MHMQTPHRIEGTVKLQHTDESCFVIMCHVPFGWKYAENSMNSKRFQMDSEAKQEYVFTLCGYYGYPLPSIHH